jgi:hypothetical protein
MPQQQGGFPSPGKMVNGVWYADAANPPGGRYNPLPGQTQDTLWQLARRSLTPVPPPPNPNEPPGGWDPSEPAVQTDPDAGPIVLPSAPVPELYDRNVDLRWMGPGSPSGAQVEGTGMPDPAGGGMGPAPGLSWRWSGQPPSASDLARDRAAFLAANDKRQAEADAALQPQVDFNPVQETMPGRPVTPGTKVLWTENDVSHRGGLSPDEWTAVHRPDIYAGQMGALAMQNARATTPEGQAAERARRIEESDSDLWLHGLQRAKMQGKIGVEQAMVEPNAYMRPESRAARGMAFSEGISQANNPDAMAIEERRQASAEKIAAIRALQGAFSSQMGVPMLGGNIDALARQLGLGGADLPAGPGGPAGGGQPNQGAVPATAKVVGQARVEAFAKSQNPRLTFDQALAQVKAEGYKVQMDDGTIR